MNRKCRQLIGGSTLFVLTVFFAIFGCAHKDVTKSRPTQPEPIFASKKAISHIDISENQKSSVVSIRGNNPLTYTAVKHQYPLGVVLYFPETTLEGIQEDYTTDNTIIETIHASEMKRKTTASRIEIRMKKDVPYEVKRQENKVLVAFLNQVDDVPQSSGRSLGEPKVIGRQSVRGFEQEASDVRKVDAPHWTSKSAEPIQPADEPASEIAEDVVKTPQTKSAVVTAINFETLGEGKSRLAITTTEKVVYKVRKSSDKRLLLMLPNAKIPKFQRRPLVTTRFKSAVDRVIPLDGEEGPATIAIELREAVPYLVYQDSNTCLIDFEASSVPPRPMSETPAEPAWIRATRSDGTVALVEAPEKQEPPDRQQRSSLAEKSDEPSRETARSMYRGEWYGDALPTFTGERISLDFQNVDIHNIFRILYEVSGKNFVIGDEVSGRMTLKLRDVPWDQALELVLQTNSLGATVNGNIIHIETLEAMRNRRVAKNQKLQAERDAQKNLEPLLTEYIVLSYAPASRIKPQIEALKADERGTIAVDQDTNMIIINATRELMGRAKLLIQRLDEAYEELATRQVMIEARVVEANTNFTRDIGVQWGGDYTATGHDGSADVTGTLFGTGASTSNATPNFAVDLPPASYSSGLGFTFGRIGGTVLNLDLRLLAMEENGKGRTISSPKVLTLDNKKATIKQITKIPYQVTDDNTTSIETEEAGIELSVTPQITRDKRIRMTIFAEKGAPDWSNTVNGNPAIDTNTAETELFVNDGETIVIGGILTTTDTLSQAGVPWFSKIPLIGWLFKQKKTVKEKNELLIFITPKIVELEKPPRIDS